MTLNKKVWILLSFSSLSILFFALNYCTSVCPFIDGLKNSDILINLSIIFILHIITRVMLFKIFNNSFVNITPYRQKYYLSVISWLLAGFYAAILHYILYPNFPISSHLKLLSGYWLIGAGVLAQLEYILFEYTFKKNNKNIILNDNYNEQLSKRLLESFIIFTLLPTSTLILLVGRYYYEGKIDGHLIQETLYVGVFSVLSAIVVAIFIGKLISKDTKDITKTISAIHNGDFTNKLNISRADELGEIANGINFMNQGLAKREKIQEAFGKFVDPQIAKDFIDNYIENENTNINFTGKKVDMAILMCDIRDFTPLSEKLSSNEIVEILNDFFEISIDAIQSNNGIINKFIGDAIMAIFGIHNDNTKEEDALKAAMQMQKDMIKLNNKLIKKGLPKINIGIGLHTGEVTSGYIGTTSRFEFTVIGNTVNMASRIESATKEQNHPILFSKEFSEKISTNFKSKYITTRKLKGISKDIELYTI